MNGANTPVDVERLTDDLLDGYGDGLEVVVRLPDGTWARITGVSPISFEGGVPGVGIEIEVSS